MVVANIFADLIASLRNMGLLEPGETPSFTALSGGVSSDIWRVDLRRGPVCLKRALSKLRVEKDWFSPIERSDYELSWFREVERIKPSAVPRILGQDLDRHLFVMEYLPPVTHHLWKSELLEGRADPAFAKQVGDTLGQIHAATALRHDVADRFRNDSIFYSIRLEPYLVSTARAHPDLAPELSQLVTTTASTKLALVHGDVSPKNILDGPCGPVFLDAECAWYGDPAFDLSFCLNHLLLKCLWTRSAAKKFLDCFESLSQGYLACVSWEPPNFLEGRAARLLPALFLARVDGKSPVEYLTAEVDREQVRRFARRLIQRPVKRLESIREEWAGELQIA
jgi:aminoglycoside phosphotransferase (APT) family kinase protein